MKTKEIVILIVALVVIVVSAYFGYTLLFPKSNTENVETTKAEEVNVVPREIDETTYKAVETLADYGKPNLEGLGKTDLFAN